MHNCTFDFGELGLSTEDVLNEMGYTNSTPDSFILETLNVLFKEVETFVRSSSCFRIFNGYMSGSGVHLNSDGVLEVGNIIAGLLEGSTTFALFAATAGHSFQYYQENVKKEEDLLKSFLLDVLGTCIVEKTGNMMELLLGKEIAGLRHTHRFSPGYCGWPLTGQKALFHLLGGDPCDIALSDVCLMSPIKSISGIIGIGQAVNERKYACRYCELETCYKQKIRS